MANFDVWDVVKVPFPYSNRPVRQHRPALVIARYFSAGAPALCWVLMITSASHRRWDGDIEIADAAMAGLPAPSIVRCAKIATIETAEAETIGRLPSGLRPLVRDVLAGMLRQGKKAGSSFSEEKEAKRLSSMKK
jgi:mRNA interferase MazF